MDSESYMEECNDEPTELDIVREQLNTYQMLNNDLSKKIQEVKIGLNATNKELITVRNELMAEKLISSELRRTLLTVNGQCLQFFNGYYANIQKCSER